MHTRFQKRYWDLLGSFDFFCVHTNCIVCFQDVQIFFSRRFIFHVFRVRSCWVSLALDFLMTRFLHIQLTGIAKLYRIPVPRSPSYGPIPSLRYHHWPNYHNMGKRDHSLAGAHPKVTEGDSANGGDSSRSERRTVPNGALGSRFNDGLVLKLQDGW